MSVDWDAEVLGPVMSLFGEGEQADPSTLPTYTPVQGSAFQLPDAVFDRAYADVTVDDQGGQITTLRPCLGVRTSLFAARQIEPQQNDTVYIPSVGLNFIVMEPRFDGHGHAKLMLMQAAQ